MPVDSKGLRKSRAEIWLALAAVLLLLVLIFVPPFISLNHYKARLSQIVATAVGRPVRLSDVELRVLPRPGFLISNLTVQEDPKYGFEPVLHASSVVASIRMAALWRGRMEVSRISVDEASLNLVRMADGEWNFDSFFRNAATGSGNAAAQAHQPPYLEATNSQIHIKNGVEKLPFALLDADASMWRESDGTWRVRLQGQPARTDVSLDMEDTGVVRLEGTLHPNPQLNAMPLHIDLYWREAQLGQLSRLVLSSDEGWRGGLAGELHLDGTAESAMVRGRLRADGVHRAEFTPAAAMDFDANCSFGFHYTRRSIDGLLCESPVGSGRARLTGDLPGGASASNQPKLMLELDRIPAQVMLDLLRTMRRGIDPSLQAQGAISGRLTYDPSAVAEGAPEVRIKGRAAPGNRSSHGRETTGPLSGGLVATGLQISGEALSKPIQAANVKIEPGPIVSGQEPFLSTSVSIPAGGPVPLAMSAKFSLSRFAVTVRGTASIPRLREFVGAMGSSAQGALAQLAGDPGIVDFLAEGPWVPPAETTLSDVRIQPTSVHNSGTLILRNANWKASFLASPVLISAATVHIGESPSAFPSLRTAGNQASETPALLWDPVEFSYGAVKGTATVKVFSDCAAPQGCPFRFKVRFGAIDAAELQAAMLGAHQSGTLLSTLLDKLKPSAAQAWPEMEGTATAESLVLGPLTLSNLIADVTVGAAGTDISSFSASVLGGNLNGKATVTVRDKPQYKVEATLAHADAAELGHLAGLGCAGTFVSGEAKLDLNGYSVEDLGQSAKGEILFDWRSGAITGQGVPGTLSRFDRWSGEAAVSEGKVKLVRNQVQRGLRSTTVSGAITLGNPASVTFGAASKGASEPATEPPGRQ